MSKKMEKMAAAVKKHEEMLKLKKRLMDFTKGEVVSEGHKDWEYFRKQPYISIGTISTWSEGDTKEKIQEVKKFTKGLTDGIVCGYSSWDDDGWDTALITVPLENLNKKTIAKAVSKIRKYSPGLKVTFTRMVKEEY